MNTTQFIAHLSLGGVSQETLKAYRSDLAFFQEYLKQRKLRVTQVTPTVILEYAQYMKKIPNQRFKRVGLSDATVARRTAAVSSWYEFGRLKNPTLLNPTKVRFSRQRRPKRIHDYQGKALDENTIETLVKGISNVRDRALFLLALSSGLRLSEVHQLDIAGITQETETRPDGTPFTYGTGMVIGKGNKQRRFYFDQDAITAITDYLLTRTDNCPALFISERKQRMSRRAIQFTISTWAQRLGIGHAHFHQVRHSFATRLANANISAVVLKDLLGHSKFETTTRYFRLSEQTKSRQYHAAMEFVSGNIEGM